MKPPSRHRRKPARWPAYRRVPQFVPVPVRNRRDGWTAARQAMFIGVLAASGSVAQAARAAGMARETAYRLRRRAGAESFAHAWDVVVAARAGREVAPRKVTPQELWVCALEGPVAVRLWRGRYAFFHRQPSDTALLRLVSSCGRPAMTGRERGW